MALKAPEILERGAQHMRDRAASRDQENGERSMKRTVEAFNALTGHTLSERDGWMFMVALKAARACSTPTGVSDDYEDGAAYFGLAGESAPSCAVVERVVERGGVPFTGMGVDMSRDGKDVTVVSVAVNGALFVVPDGYNFVAQDKDGTVWAYEDTPRLVESDVSCEAGWANRGWEAKPAKRLGMAPLSGLDWRQSLMNVRVLRPDVEKA